MISAKSSRAWVLASCLAGAVGSCTGSIEDGTLDPGPLAPSGTGGAAGNRPVVDPVGLPGAPLAATSRLRRLTVDEYDRTVSDLFQRAAKAGDVFPTDIRKPFDNDYTTQVVSSTLISGAELLARDVSSSLLADKPRRDKVVGCTPTGATGADASACLRTFITRIGRLAWRRTLDQADIQNLMKFESVARQDNDFYAAVDAVIRTLLQDPEFLFRVEGGAEVGPGLFKLGGTEMATRLSYFLLGTTPDDALLTVAEMGGLDTADQVRKAAAGLLAQPRALGRMARFHALWMGYERPPASPLAGAMKAETDKLMARVIFQDRLPWQELLRMKETYVSYDLGIHYGLHLPATLKKGGSAWVPYTGTKRQGLLSHASFLQLGVKSGDTSVIFRGKDIRERLFCQVITKPPGVDTTQMPTASPCKRDQALARVVCSGGCHKPMDLVGLGLENYDALGKLRRYDQNQATGQDFTQCPISGDGELQDLSTGEMKKFNGPAELGGLMLANPELNRCAAKQVYRFAMGKTGIDSANQQFLDVISQRLGTADFRFDELLLDFVSSAAFAHRRAGN